MLISDLVPVPSSFLIISVILSAAFFASMVLMISLCTCCKSRQPVLKEHPDMYGVHVSPPIVQFQNGQSRASADYWGSSDDKNGRSLPNPPTSNIHDPHCKIAVIKQWRNETDVKTTTTTTERTSVHHLNQGLEQSPPTTYICIDAQSECTDPLYSKVVDPNELPVESHRRYDYPLFSKPSIRTDDRHVYQRLDDQGSEDPYSSIASGGKGGDSVEEPGYALVKGEQLDNRLPASDDDAHLYTKLVHHHSVPTADHQQQHSVQPLPPPPPPPRPDSLQDQQQQQQSNGVLVREPSYRYITVRENANVVRGRIEQWQDRNRPPIREHYYSTIGSEHGYEVVPNVQRPSVERQQPFCVYPNGSAIEDSITYASNFDYVDSPTVTTSTPQRLPIPPPIPPTSPIPSNSSISPVAPSILQMSPRIEASTFPVLEQLSDSNVLPIVPITRSMSPERPYSVIGAENEPFSSGDAEVEIDYSAMSRREKTHETQGKVKQKQDRISISTTVAVDDTSTFACSHHEDDLKPITQSVHSQTVPPIKAVSSRRQLKLPLHVDIEVAKKKPYSRDYVSPLGLGSNRSWPLVKEAGFTEHIKEKDSSGNGDNIGSFNTSHMRGPDTTTQSDSQEECTGTCYCHSVHPELDRVRDENLYEMDKAGWGRLRSSSSEEPA